MAGNTELNRGIQEEFHPSLVKAHEAAILKARPVVIGARAKVEGDEAAIYNTLITELIEEGEAQRALADKRGISLPTDAGATAIEKIKAKFFSKMDQGQMVDSFKNITSRISQKRLDNPKYTESTDYLMDTYWLLALLQRMQDTRYIDDPQGEAEKMVLDTIGATGLDVGEYTDHITNYRKISHEHGGAKEHGLTGSFDLGYILSDGLRRAQFKDVLLKIGLTTDMLNSVLSRSDVNDLMINVDRNLMSYDLVPIGITDDDLKGFIKSLSGASASVINDLKSIIS